MNTVENNSREGVQNMEDKYHEAVNAGVTHVALTVENVEGVLAYIHTLIREIPLEVEDRVIEVGADEPSGTIIDIREFNDELVYEVRLDKPSKHFGTIIYYQNEIELYERAT